MSFRSDDGGAAPAMLLLTCDDVIARLEGLLGSLGGAAQETLLAFDADGTLWSGDVGIDNFEALLTKGAVLPQAAPALRDEATSCGLPIASDPTAQARILYDAYLRGVYHEDRAFRMMAWIFAGYSEDAVRAFATTTARAADLKSRLHAEILPVLAWAARRGVFRYVVSASHAIVVRSSLESLGLPIDGVFAMTQAKENDLLAARVEEPATYGAGKTAALNAGVTGKTLLGAFGDSAFDLHLLREARLAVAVRPKAELRARAAECGGLVELAPAAR